MFEGRSIRCGDSSCLSIRRATSATTASLHASVNPRTLLTSTLQGLRTPQAGVYRSRHVANMSPKLTLWLPRSGCRWIRCLSALASRLQTCPFPQAPAQLGIVRQGRAAGAWHVCDGIRGGKAEHLRSMVMLAYRILNRIAKDRKMFTFRDFGTRISASNLNRCSLRFRIRWYCFALTYNGSSSSTGGV